MTNVKLVKAKGSGWFLTIGKITWAVSSWELWLLDKLIKNHLEEITDEMEKVE